MPFINFQEHRKVRTNPLLAFREILSKRASLQTRGLLSLALLLAIFCGPVFYWIARADNTAQALPLAQDWSNATLITAADNWSGVPGIVGYRGDDLATATGTDPQTILVDGTSTPIQVVANLAVTTNTTGGLQELDGITNPTIAFQGSGTADAPFLLININTSGRSNINVAYNLRDLDASGDNATQQVALHFRVGNSGNFTNVPAAYVADATQASAATLVTPVNVTLPAAADNQALVQVRIMTTNAAGNDELVGIDDISITGTGGSNALSLSCSPTSFAENDGNAASTCTVTRTGSTAADLTVNLQSSDTTEATVLSNVIIPMGSESTTFSVTAVDDLEVDGTQTVTITASATNFTNAMASVMVTDNDQLTTVFIHDIQGNGEIPNGVGQLRQIQGIVVGDFQGTTGLSGFFVQEEDADADADATTSEGIFVFEGANSTPVNVGDKVTVIGTVLNFGGPPGLTELSPVTSVTVNSTGNPLPATQTVALPAGISPAADFERFEGMLVQFTNQTLFVTGNEDLGAFGELNLSATNPLYIPTNSIDPNDNPATGNSTAGNSNVAAITAQQLANNNNRIILDDGRSGSNLSPIAFIGAGTDSTIRRGDSIANLSGVMSYGFGSYRIEPSSAPLNFTALNLRPATPASVGSSTLRVVSFNVENYFATTGTGRGPDNPAELVRKRDKVIAALTALNADVIGLIELEKGTQGTPDAALNDIIGALNTQGIGTYAVVSTPVEVYTAPVGTDTEIKSGIIYRTAAVSPVGASFTDTVAASGAYSRAPIAQTFQQTSNNQKFTLVVNHFRSKSCPGSGEDADMGDGQACFNGRRRNQALAVTAFVTNTIVPIDPDVLVVGDLNAYGQEDPIDVFRAAGYGDLIGQYVSPANQYSFIFEAEGGLLDHAFATSTLNSQVTGATIWHINTDEPSVFDYNTNNKPADDRYAVTPFASADHDPLLIGLNLTVSCPTINVSHSTVSTGTAGQAFGPVQFQQTGGAGAITWSVSSNNLPAGLTLNPQTGELSGIPTSAAGVNITVRATDANNCFGEVTVTLQINCPTITLSPSSGSPTILSSGTVGQIFSQTFTAAPASGSYTYSIPPAAVPPGLTFNTVTGILSGTPTIPGTYGFTLSASAFGVCTGEQSYSLTINCPAITISPAGPALHAGVIGEAYSQQLTANNASGTVNFTLSSGALPLGLTMSLAGLISGTPTQSGTANFIVLATDANGCTSTASYSLTVSCPAITISPLTLPAATTQVSYNQTVSAAPSGTVYNFATTAGALPTGLTLGSTTGVISGTPTAAGTYTFTITATGFGACTGTREYTITVASSCAAFSFSPATLPVGLKGAAYNTTFTTVSANGAVSYSRTAGTLPAGLSLAAAGALTGTPTAAGSFDFTITATDVQGCTFSRSYTLVIDAIAGSLGDPLVCLGPGGIVAVEATVTNSGATPQTASFTAALPPQLLAIPGSCTVNTGTCMVVNASTVQWDGQLNANQTVTIRYQTQASDSAVPGAQLCINSVATIAGAGPFTVQACTVLNCPPVGPGATFPFASAVSDQKAGSVLVYNLYTSDASNGNLQNTRISLTNTDVARTAYVHLFFVDGASCSIADSVLCLTPNQTASFLASDVDPGTSGYLVAVAMDRNGCPISFNHLIGDAFVKLGSGHAANLAAEAVAAVPGSGPLCDANAPTATLFFNGVMYNPLPRVLALSNLGSLADGNSTLLVVNRIGGNLTTGASTLAGLFGILYDDGENPFSFGFSPGTCQARNLISSSFPRTTPRLDQVIPAGRSGWLKFSMQTDAAILGAAINFNANAGTTAGAFNQGHNLHKLTLTTAASVTIPVFPPSC